MAMRRGARRHFTLGYDIGINAPVKVLEAGDPTVGFVCDLNMSSHSLFCGALIPLLQCVYDAAVVGLVGLEFFVRGKPCNSPIEVELACAKYRVRQARVMCGGNDRIVKATVRCHAELGCRSNSHITLMLDRFDMAQLILTRPDRCKPCCKPFQRNPDLEVFLNFGGGIFPHRPASFARCCVAFGAESLETFPNGRPTDLQGFGEVNLYQGLVGPEFAGYNREPQPLVDIINRQSCGSAVVLTRVCFG